MAAALAVLLTPRLFGDLYRRLSAFGLPFVSVVENRSGVITVDAAGRVYGGGAYDGAFNLDPKSDINGVTRIYAALSIHPAPRRVLEIGLSSGSWAQIIANHPGVEHVEVVEINPGYLALIRSRPLVAGLLRDPKVHIDIDDGRRWLRRQQDRFDLIVMNTTWHWRSNATNLLSREFLELARVTCSRVG